MSLRQVCAWTLGALSLGTLSFLVWAQRKTRLEDNPVPEPEAEEATSTLKLEKEPEGTRWWWSTRHNRETLLALSAQLKGAPVFVYARHVLEARIAQLKSLSNIDRLFCAIKANNCPELMKVLYMHGVGFECVSIEELRYVHSLFPGIDLGRVLFTPNFASRQDLVESFELAGTVTLDNSWMIERWSQELTGRTVFIRIDLGGGLGHHAHVVTAGKQSKFGISEVELLNLLPLIKMLKINVEGLHIHKGSGITDLDAWLKSAEALGGLMQYLPGVKVLDLGGGLGVPYREEEGHLPIQELNGNLAGFKQRFPAVSIWLEPGRFFMAEQGVLLTTVTQIKNKSGQAFVGVNTGMNALVRPALYDSYHHIENLTKLGTPIKGVLEAHVVGPICESGDILGHSRPLPLDTEEGDVILIACAGAYGQTMSSFYNRKNVPQEVVLEAS
eukprot:gb/GEZN01008357.1/.p1 GENE.gb/GEZN01008357.1/~~gb/GEZN01008357.1/.p1  ORF type:complete len:460 (-),score=37.97 gb/GEZN01008357.1/:58-1386(-)